MRMPFERLMEHVSAVADRDRAGVTLGELSERWHEPPDRIMDAIIAARVLRGERTYITLPDLPWSKPDADIIGDIRRIHDQGEGPFS